MTRKKSFERESVKERRSTGKKESFVLSERTKLIYLFIDCSALGCSLFSQNREPKSKHSTISSTSLRVRCVLEKRNKRRKKSLEKTKSCVKLDKQRDKHAVALFEARDSIAWLINESGNKI